MPPEWVNLFWGSGDMIICSTTSSQNTVMSSGGPAQLWGSRICSQALPWQRIIMLGALRCLHENTSPLGYQRDPGAVFWWNVVRSFVLCKTADIKMFSPKMEKLSASVNFISNIHSDNDRDCPSLLAQGPQNLANNRDEGVKKWVISQFGVKCVICLLGQVTQSSEVLKWYSRVSHAH